MGMLILLETGRRLGVRRRPKESEGERGSLGTIEGAVFALFGLLMAFTFSGAALRFNEKRMLVAEEVNTFETAYLRLDLLTPEAYAARASRPVPARADPPRERRSTPGRSPRQHEITTSAGRFDSFYRLGSVFSCRYCRYA